MVSRKPKVFGIGLSKTGTTSLARALDMLGYRVKDYPGVTSYNSGDLSSIDAKTLDSYDAFTDTPIPSFYRELDAKYPGSKFILTVRDENSWLKSCKKQFTQKLADKQNDAHNRLFMDLYDCTVFDEKKFLNGYRIFINDVQDYFKNRSADLLILDIAKGEGWEKLCPFLGKTIPSVPFPKANVTQIQWINLDNLVSLVQNAGKEAFTARAFMLGIRHAQSTGVISFFRKPGHIPDLLKYRLSKNKLGIPKTAIRIAESILIDGLRKINPNIPIISPYIGFNTPYPERCNWNHFWLIDPFNSTEGFSEKGSTITSSIALIEDRIPILGIVCNPESDIVYYGMKGKGSYKIAFGGEPILMNGIQNMDTDCLSLQSEPLISSAQQIDNNQQHSNINLQICQAVDYRSRAKLPFTDSMEWETAPAHAIASAAGIRILNIKSKRELSYNKEEFKNSGIVVEPTLSKNENQ